MNVSRWSKLKQRGELQNDIPHCTDTPQQEIKWKLHQSHSPVEQKDPAQSNEQHDTCDEVTHHKNSF